MFCPYGPPYTTDSNEKNLRTILELLKPPDKSFASKVINFVRVFTRKFYVNYRGYDIIFRFPREAFTYQIHRCIITKLYQTLSYNLVYNYQSY